MLDHAIAATTAAADAPVTIYIATNRVDVQSIEQLLASEGDGLVAETIVVVVS